jgi:hypothetical protein
MNSFCDARVRSESREGFVFVSHFYVMKHGFEQLVELRWNKNVKESNGKWQVTTSVHRSASSLR